ncbi:hypothetical protein QQ045_002486 [Rhodiola kirilowii]
MSIRGQGYDGASNMRGEWNGLQALVLCECPYAYYVHCFAHRLQLSLVAASKEVYHVHHFFEKLNFIVSASCKRNDQLKDAHASNMAFLLAIGDLKSGSGLYQLEVPDFSAPHEIRRGASHQQNRITIEHYYRVDIFYTVIDSQLQELNNRFNDDTVELIILSSTLDPKELRTTLRVDDICKLVDKFYPINFDEDERISLCMELQHLKLPDFNTLIEISELCQWLTRTRKSNMFPLIYKVITFIMTLLVFTATNERSFSRMNIVKNALRNNMKDDFLYDCLVINVEE